MGNPVKSIAKPFEFVGKTARDLGGGLFGETTAQKMARRQREEMERMQAEQIKYEKEMMEKEQKRRELEQERARQEAERARLEQERIRREQEAKRTAEDLYSKQLAQDTGTLRDKPNLRNEVKTSVDYSGSKLNLDDDEEEMKKRDKLTKAFTRRI